LTLFLDEFPDNALSLRSVMEPAFSKGNPSVFDQGHAINGNESLPGWDFLSTEKFLLNRRRNGSGTFLFHEFSSF
jgi:hypothetical protein